MSAVSPLSCSPLDRNPPSLRFHNQTRLETESCFQTMKERQSQQVGIYSMSNFHDCEPLTPMTRQMSLEQPTVNYRDGYGWTTLTGSNIDNDSELRNARNLTNPRLIVRSQTRPYLTVPYMGRGQGDVCVESRLITGEPDNNRRPCNVLSGVQIDRFDPQVPCIKDNVQNPVHIIPEDSKADWVRGGQASRSLIRNTDYLNQCGYQYNGKYWVKTPAHGTVRMMPQH